MKKLLAVLISSTLLVFTVLSLQAMQRNIVRLEVDEETFFFSLSDDKNGLKMTASSEGRVYEFNKRADGKWYDGNGQEVPNKVRSSFLDEAYERLTSEEVEPQLGLNSGVDSDEKDDTDISEASNGLLSLRSSGGSSAFNRIQTSGDGNASTTENGEGTADAQQYVTTTNVDVSLVSVTDASPAVQTTRSRLYLVRNHPYLTVFTCGTLVMICANLAAAYTCENCGDGQDLLGLVCGCPVVPGVLAGCCKGATEAVKHRTSIKNTGKACLGGLRNRFTAVLNKAKEAKNKFVERCRRESQRSTSEENTGT